MAEPGYCDPAAFWDSLIGQQDRHYGNYRFDVTASAPPLGLIDSGYAFAAPTPRNHYYPHASVFVSERRRAGRLDLSSDELRWLAILVTDNPLMDTLQDILAPEQFQAFRARISRMINPPTQILGVLEF